MDPVRMNRKDVALFWVQFGTWRPRDASYGVVFHGGIIELACRSFHGVLGSDGGCQIAATGTGVRSSKMSIYTM